MIRDRFALTAFLLTGSLVVAAPPSARLEVTPTVALSKLAKLDGRNPAITKDETGLFEDARKGKFSYYTFAEACLIAGGVEDPRDRREYINKLDFLEAEGRKATAGSKSVAEDGARLLKFLHTGPMAKGYKTEQTDLHVLLDTGEFNCVSSAALYTVMGQRLGIDVRAVEVPQHVFSVLATRDRKIDVETTNIRGFDLDPKRRDGPAKADRPLDNRREVGPPGLAGIIAFNHGVSYSRQKRFAQSIRSYLIALGIDSGNRHAEENLIVDLVNWPLELAKAEKYAKAMEVLAVGRELVPNEPALRQNTLALFDTWAKVSMDRKDWAGAIRVYEQALRELPGDKHMANNLAYCRAQTR
jgi:tetratricopeptide (TPR) repeat protein